MAQFIAAQTAQAGRRAGESVIGEIPLYRSEYFGPGRFFYSMSKPERFKLHEQLLEQPEAPHAFLIEVPANSESPAHFHRVPQYQVFVQGGGKLGRKHDLEPVTFHYTDEFTGYGPILAADGGLAYFTLRNYFDPGAEYVDQPNVREKLRPSARRYLVAGPTEIAPVTAAALTSQKPAASVTVIEPHEDGVAAFLFRAGADIEVAGPDPSAGGGQYWLVLQGSIVYLGAEYVAHSLAWVSASESAMRVTSGANGAEVAVVQFSRVMTSRVQSAQH